MKKCGFDIGHCLSAGAYLKYNESKKNWTPSSIQVNNKGETTVLTQLMLTNEQLEKLKKHLDGIGFPEYKFLETLGEIKIGKDVPMETKDGRIFRYFKIHPAGFKRLFGEDEQEKQALRINHGTLIACFCYAILKQCIKIEGNDFIEEDREKLELIIGCPATYKWTSEKAKEEYAALVKKATGVKSVQIVPESRGALFGVANSGKNISVAKGVIIFDFGSSTADCTYMLLGKRLAEFSWDLGASSIEKEMTKAAVTAVRNSCNAKGITPFFNNDVLVKANRELREVKEDHFKGTYPDGQGYIVRYKDPEGKECMEAININDSFMEEIINCKSISIDCGNNETKTGAWSELCKEFFEEAKNIIINKENLPVGTIVLTGGASQMDFIAEKCEEVFGIKPSFEKSNVEHAVSYGLAWVSASEEKYPELFEEAKKDILNEEECKTSDVIDSFKEGTFKFMFGRICKIAEIWCEDDKCKTRERLTNWLVNYFSDDKIYKQYEDEVTNKIINAFGEKLESPIIKSVNKYTAELYAPEITEAIGFDSSNIGEVKAEIGKIDLRGPMYAINTTPLSKRALNWLREKWDGVQYNKKDLENQQTKELTKEEKLKLYDSYIKGIASQWYDFQGNLRTEIDKSLNDDVKINEKLAAFIDAKIKKAFRVAMLMDFEKIGWSD